MQQTQMQKIENYFELFLILFLILIFLYIIKDYLLVIFVSAIFVFLFQKFYKFLLRIKVNKNIAALFILFILITIILLPLYILILALIKEVTNLFVQGSLLFDRIDSYSCTYAFCETIMRNMVYLDFNFEKIMYQVGSIISKSVYSLFNSITNFIINIGIFVLSFFFLLRDGDKFLRYIKKLIPMHEDYKNLLLLKFKTITISIFVDSLLVAIIQGSLLGLGFYLVGFQSPILWGTIAIFFALIPIFGTTILWIPAVIYLFINESYLLAIFLALYSMFVIGLSDDGIRTLLLNRRTKVHPFLIFISIIGGISVFGFLGIFIGPIIISSLITVLHLYKLDFN